MPNEKVLETKKAQVAQIVEALNGATTGVLMDYRGLTVEEDTKLRNDLRAAGVKYFVVKNTLLRLAANQVGLEELDSILHGPTALAISEDPVAPAKILFDFAKNNEKVEIKSGFMDGKVLSEEELTRLAPMMYENKRGTFVVINELFTTAASYDALIMGKRVLKHFVELGCMGIYVTHLKELADKQEGIVSLRAMLDENRVQTFEIRRGEAEDTPCAENLVNKHQLTYAQLKERL